MEFPIGVEVKKRIARFYKYLPNSYTLESVPGGKMYLNRAESRMMFERTLGVYEYWKTQLFKEILKPEMVVVDVGVNKGYFSLLSARLVGEKGRVLSFEPDPTNCEWIKKSIAENGYKSIKLFPMGLSDENGEFDFYVGKKSGQGSLLFNEKDAVSSTPIKVKTVPLDSVLKDENVSKVNLMKIDVQGADLKVIKGSLNALNNLQYLIMDVDTKILQEQEEIFEIVKAKGFKIYSVSKERKQIFSPMDMGNIKDIFCTR